MVFVKGSGKVWVGGNRNGLRGIRIMHYFASYSKGALQKAFLYIYSKPFFLSNILISKRFFIKDKPSLSKPLS